MHQNFAVPRHVLEALMSDTSATAYSLASIDRRLARLEAHQRLGATPEQLELIEKELAENKAKLGAATAPAPETHNPSPGESHVAES